MLVFALKAKIKLVNASSKVEKKPRVSCIVDPENHEQTSVLITWNLGLLS